MNLQLDPLIVNERQEVVCPDALQESVTPVGKSAWLASVPHHGQQGDRQNG